MTPLAVAGVVLRWTLFAAVLVQTGAAAFRFLVVGRLAVSDAGSGTLRAIVSGRAAQLGWLAAMLGCVAALGRLPLQLAELHDPAASLGLELPALVGHTTWGWIWISQVIASLLAIPSFRAARRDGAGPWRFAALCSLLLVGSLALTGHAFGHERSGIAVTAMVLHLLGGSVWVGAMVSLYSGIRVNGDPQHAARLVGAFSPLALTGATLVLLTGVISSWLYLGTLSALWQSRYGRTLGVKLVAVVGMAILGAWNWRVATPGLRKSGGPEPIKRSLTAELLAGALILLVTAVLVVTPEPGQE